MPTILTGGLVLAALLTLTPSPSQAPCAWMLWLATTVRVDPLWKLLDSFGSEQACKAKRDTLQKRMGGLHSLPYGETLEWQYRCFPETFDPRERR